MESPPATLAETFQPQSIHSQDLSPLFNKLASEIRNLIYEYAFTEDPAAPPSARNFAVQLNHDKAPLPAEATRDVTPSTDATPGANWYAPVRTRSDWVRPDCPGVMPMELLRTCKRIYLEARGLPILQKEFRFYFYRGPKEQPDSITQADFERFFNQTLAQWSSVPNYRRLDLVRSVRLFTQMFWLEDHTNHNLSWICSETEYFSQVENLRITFRRGDWWWWEDKRPPLISPFRGNCAHPEAQSQMDADVATTLGGGQVPFTTGVWGLAFKRMPKLKTLVMDFETSEDNKDQVSKIVQWAQHWRLPAASGSGEPAMCFSAAGIPVQKMSWRGLPQHWGGRCGVCLRRAPRRGRCDACMQEMRLFNAGYGPRLFVWTVTWKLVRDDGGNHGSNREA